jgi:type IV secretory pathway VirB10-like protein
MMPKTQAPSTLRPRSPKPRGISRKVTIGLAGVGAAAVIAVFAFDPGFSMSKTQPEPLPMLSNVKPDLSMLPSDYSQTQTASVATPGAAPLAPALDLPPPAADPQFRPAVQNYGPAAPKRRKIRAGIAVGGDDGLGDTGQGQAPGVQMVADMQQSAAGQPPQPRTVAQGFRQQNSAAGDMYLPQGVQAPLGEWEIWPGTIIPAKLASATNSELGGNVVARVSADIYDNRSGQCRMIPRDSTVFGKLSDEVQYGQRRQQAVWSMLILPNGRKLSLMGMDATDGAGRAGITANVNNHYGRLAVAAIGATALDVLSGLARSTNNGTQINIGGAAADNAASIGERIIQRELQVQPNLEQVIGHPVSLMVDRTIVMGCYDE